MTCLYKRPGTVECRLKHSLTSADNRLCLSVGHIDCYYVTDHFMLCKALRLILRSHYAKVWQTVCSTSLLFSRTFVSRSVARIKHVWFVRPNVRQLDRQFVKPSHSVNTTCDSLFNCLCNSCTVWTLRQTVGQTVCPTVARSVHTVQLLVCPTVVKCERRITGRASC